MTMIQFSLRCDEDHRFESWFKSSAAFEKLHAAGMLSCAICGSVKVDKALMAPKVRDSKSKPAPREDEQRRQTLAELKKKIEENSEYVGLNFAREAREIHQGIAPERSIYGEARADDAKKLIEDGVPVTPLPFVPGRKSN